MFFLKLSDQAVEYSAGGRIMFSKGFGTFSIVAILVLLPVLSTWEGTEGTIVDDKPVSLEKGEVKTVIIHSDDSINIHIDFGPPVISQLNVDGEKYSTLSFSGSTPTGSVGKPMLPALNIPIALPDENARMEIETGSTIGIITDDHLLPLQEADPDMIGEEETGFAMDSGFYSSPVSYPSSQIDRIGGRISDVPFNILEITPALMKSSPHEVQWTTSIDVEMTWDQAERILVDSSSPFLDIYPRIFENWEHFDYSLIPSPTKPYQGNGCDFVIITHPSLINASMKLAAWKNMKGTETHVYDLDQIGRTREEIMSFMEYCYEDMNPRPYHFLFMGDSDLVPTNYVTGHPYYYDRYLIGTDLYYSTVSGSDYFPDLFTGRIPANNQSHAEMMVNKIINYELDPPRHEGFYENVTLAAYFQDNDRDDYADRRFAQTSEETYQFTKSLGYNSSRIYYADSTVTPQYWNLGTYSSGEPIPPQLLRSNGFGWNGSKRDITDAFHNGSFLITHRDHGGTYGWGEPSFHTSDVRNLKNGELLPVVFSINCLTGYFDNETSLGPMADSEESFAETLIGLDGGGAVGVVSATRVSYSGYNDYFYKGLYDAMYPSLNSSLGNATPLYSMGEVLNYGKYFMSATWGDTWDLQQVEYELFHYLGDPTMELWTSYPETVDVNHSDYMSMGSELIMVESDVENATVSVTMNGTILGVGTVKNGSVNVSVEGLCPGNLTVTVTKHDHIPHISTIVINATSSDLKARITDYNRSGTAGFSWSVHGCVENIGSTPHSSINVSLLLDDTIVDNTTIQSLPSGLEHDVNFSFTPPDDGWHTIAIEVENRSESSTWNNRDERDIMILGKPGMRVEPPSSVDLWWRTGDVTTFDIALNNSDHGRLDYVLEDRTLFSDGFSTTELNDTRWVNDTLSLGIGRNGLYPPSYPYSLDLKCGEMITSREIDTSNYTDLEITYQIEMGGLNYIDESVDYIYLEYLDDVGNWIRIRTDNGDFYQDGSFELRRISLPSNASHSEFRFRFDTEYTNDYFGNGGGVFCIDDIRLTHNTSDFWIETPLTDGSLKYYQNGTITLRVNCTSLPVGNYSTYVSLISNDMDGFHHIPINLEVRENITPLADAGNDTVIDQHETVIFNGSSSTDNVGVTNWTWSFNDGLENITIYGSTPRYIFHDAGVFPVNLTVRDHAWNTDTDLVNVTVIDITDPVADCGSDIVVDQHTTVELNGSWSHDNVGITEWTWSFVDGGEINLTGLVDSYTFHNAGIFDINLTVSDAAGNTDWDTFTVSVNDTTDPIPADIADITVDQNEVFLLNGSGSEDNMEIVNWTWNISSDESNFVLYGERVYHAISEASEYSGELTVRDSSGNVNSTEFTITVLDITPPVTGHWEDMEILQGDNLSLNGSSCEDNTGLRNWTWKLDYNGEIIFKYGPEIQHEALDAGTIYVLLRLTDLAGNRANATFEVLVIDTERPEAIILGETTIDQHERLVLNGSQSVDNVGITNFAWNIEDGESTTIYGEVLDIILDDAGLFNVTLTVTDARENNESVNVIVTVVDITPPAVEIGPDMETYTNSTVILSVNSSSDNVGIVNFTWRITLGDETVSLYGNEIEFALPYPGIWTAELTVSDAEGNSANDSLSISVLEREDDTDGDDDGGDDGSGDDTGNDGTEGGDDGGGDDGSGSGDESDDSISLWMVFIPILVMLLLVGIGAALLILGKRDRIEEEVMDWEE